MTTEEYMSKFEPVKYGRDHMMFAPIDIIYDEDGLSDNVTNLPSLAGPDGNAKLNVCPYCGSPTISESRAGYNLKWMTYECGMTTSIYRGSRILGISYRTDQCAMMVEYQHYEDVI